MRPVVIKRLILVSMWAALALSSLYVDASQTCPANIPVTSEEDDFIVLNEGEVLHVPSNLVFMRCSLGQTWQEESCTGDPVRFNWLQALQITHDYSFAGNLQWRLPNVKELSVINERACVRPSVNLAIFPATPPDEFWTSTPSVSDPERVWSVAFNNGTSSIKSKQSSLFVRLVRPYYNN